jgi:hypothetical protein
MLFNFTTGITCTAMGFAKVKDMTDKNDPNSSEAGSIDCSPVV